MLDLGDGQPTEWPGLCPLMVSEPPICGWSSAPSVESESLGTWQRGPEGQELPGFFVKKMLTWDIWGKTGWIGDLIFKASWCHGTLSIEIVVSW